MTKPFTLFIFLSLFIFQLQAQEISIQDTSFYKLSEVTIGADYLATDKTPVTFLNLSPSEIEKVNTGQEPSFLLSQLPAFTVYSDAGSYQGYSYFRMRGIDQTRLSLTLDGVPLNEPEDQGAYFSNYPDFLNSVSGVQIQRGVGTSKNGTAGFGGSLQFASPNLGAPQKTEIGIGYGSYNSYRAFAEYNSGMKGNKALYLRASHLNSDGYKESSNNTSSSLFYSGGLFFDKSFLKLTGFIGQQRNKMAWLGVSQSLIDENPRTNANAAQENDVFGQGLAHLQYVYYPSKNSVIRSGLFYNYLEGNYDFDFNNFLGFPSTEELYNYAFLSNWGGVFSNYTFENDRIKSTTGIHANLYSRQHTGSEKALGELHVNTGYKNEFSAFTKLSYQADKLLFYTDLQVRHVNFDYEGGVDFEKLDWTFFNPKLGLSYAAKVNMTFYYSIGIANREPTRNDLFGGNDDLLADSLGQALLFISQPERVIDQELGLRFKTKKWNGNLNLYYMGFDNEIILNGQFGPNGLALNSNVEQSIRTGVELSLNYHLSSKWTLTNNSSYNYSQIKQQSESFNPILTPRLIINQGVDYTIGNFNTGIAARYQSTSFIDFANDNSLEDYLLLNWRGSYQIKNWKISFFVNNLTNTNYYNNGYVDFDGTNKYFVQAPINFYGMLNYTF